MHMTLIRTLRRENMTGNTRTPIHSSNEKKKKIVKKFFLEINGQMIVFTWNILT